jgi:ATP citrate (pro-S)-lyase
MGTSAEHLSEDIQFEHAGASANSKIEKATYKNAYMRKMGIHVPDSFEKISLLINEISKTVVSKPIVEREMVIPISYKNARRDGLVRRPSDFFSGICNETKEELEYNSIPISQVSGIGESIGLLWFKRKFPTDYFELILTIVADHGPAVSGAQNTIITTRAGKDLVTSVCSGLLTIGDRFGGAINKAGHDFYNAWRSGLTPNEFITKMTTEKRYIMGIGHRVKSKDNPDKRVEMLRKYVEKHFKNRDLINYALEVEEITLRKRNNLILNVDGFIATSMIDGLQNAGLTQEEIKEYIDYDMFNGFFMLGRTVGLIGHHIDQKRLKQPLFRFPTIDITYIE